MIKQLKYILNSINDCDLDYIDIFINNNSELNYIYFDNDKIIFVDENHFIDVKKNKQND